MTKPLLAAALLAAAASAQPEPALASAADRFEQDLETVTNVLATAALIHEASGDFPRTPFGLLGSQAADRTRLRVTPLSALTIDSTPGGITVTYVPLPSDYVRDDDIVRVAIHEDDAGHYLAAYEITRATDPDLGGARLAYDTAGRYLVTRGYGEACVDVATVRQRLAAGEYAPEPGTLGPEPLTVRVHPVGGAAPIYVRSDR